MWCCRQLILLCDLYDPRSIVRHICPLGVALCMDKVSEVRMESFSLISAVLRRVNEDGEDKLLRVICSDLIDQFALNPKWSGRQIFCQMCHTVLKEMALSPPVFAEVLLPTLLALGHDSVPNVRLAVARGLAQQIVPLDYYTSSQNPCHEELLAVLQALQTDKDRDVRFYSTQQPEMDICSGTTHAFDTQVPV
ncbi:hypothetical protein ACOMHN_033602 [Nucella lapillus]